MTHTRRRVLSAMSAIGAIAVGAALAGTPPAAAAPKAAAAKAAAETVRITLPKPTGHHRIGATSLHLVDRSRPDPWAGEKPYRELMVSVRYPARASERPAEPYMLPGAAAHFDTIIADGLQVPRGTVNWAGTTTHARANAPADRAFGGRPVVLFAAGLNSPRTIGTVLVDELVSRGYIVVTIDHTYEAFEVEFPGGRVEASRTNGGDPAAYEKVLGVRVADTRFVLDQLAAVNRTHPALRGAFDLSRIGMFGHSAGGFAAAETMAVDRRIDAGVNLDGAMMYDYANGTGLGRAAAHGLDRPFLLVGTPNHGRDQDLSWRSFRAHQRGWQRELRFANSEHHTYSDLQVWLPQIAAKVPVPPEIMLAIGTIDPARAIAAQGAYLGAFFDLHLRHRGTHLFDRPAPQFPEVTLL